MKLAKRQSMDEQGEAAKLPPQPLGPPSSLLGQASLRSYGTLGL